MSQSIAPPLLASHELLEHTGELHLRIRAPDLATLLAEAGRALSRLMLRDPPQTPGPSSGPVTVQSPDRAALLVDWLNELIYRAEHDREVPTEFEMLEAGDTRVRARLRGVPVREPPALVKAATLHRVRVEPVAGGMEADVILDV